MSSDDVHSTASSLRSTTAGNNDQSIFGSGPVVVQVTEPSVVTGGVIRVVVPWSNRNR